MPVIDIEENIKGINDKIKTMTEEVYRLQGMLQIFEGFRDGGLNVIELPSDPNHKPVEEVESIQEKPE